MQRVGFSRCGAIMLGAALFAGCDSAGTTATNAGSVMPQGAQVHELATLFALTNARHVVPQIKGRLGHSWMKHVPAGTTLLYASDAGYSSVDVYDYPSGSLIGQVAGFENPYGSCSDKNGNVYVADFGAGTLSEIAEGDTTITKTWRPGGEPIGCSVDANGDIAVSLSAGGAGGFGQITVYKSGGKTGKSYPAPGDGDFWPAGYDKTGDLIVECGYGSASGPCAEGAASHIIELKKGAKSFTTLSLSGATITSPASVESMGDVLGVGDQAPLGIAKPGWGIYSSTLAGTTLTVSDTTINTGNCRASGDYAQAAQWANVSSKPNGLQVEGHVRATVAGNLDCASPTPIDTWAFPAGNGPTHAIIPSLSEADYYGMTLVK